MCGMYLLNVSLFIFCLFLQITTATSNYPIILPGFAGRATSASIQIISDNKLLVKGFSSDSNNFQFRVAKRGQVGEEIRYTISKKTRNSVTAHDYFIDLPDGQKIGDYYSLGVWTENDGFIVETKLNPKKERFEFKYIPCSTKTPNECKDNSLLPIQPPVYQRNDTILDDEPYQEDDILFIVDRDAKLKCKNVLKYTSEEFMLLSNGELWILDEPKTSVIDNYTIGYYCLNPICEDTDGPKLRILTPFACVQEEPIMWFRYMEIFVVIISVLAINLTCIIAIGNLSKIREPKILDVGYFFTTAVYFLAWLAAIFLIHGQPVCSIFVMLFQTFGLAAFVIICLSFVETYYLIRYYNEDLNSKRSYIYSVTVIAFTFLWAALSVLYPFATVNVSESDNCFLKSPRSLLYFVPTTILAFISFVLVILIQSGIKSLKEKISSRSYSIIIKDVNKRFYRYCSLLVLMLISFAAELASIFYGQLTGVLESLNFIRCAHGIFVFLMFVRYDENMYKLVKDKADQLFNSDVNQNQFESQQNVNLVGNVE